MLRPDAAVIYLENLVPAPPDTTAVVSPPERLDPIFEKDPWLPPPACNSTSSTKNLCEDNDVDEKIPFSSLPEYYEELFKTTPVIWEQVHAKFACPKDADFMKTRLRELEGELHTIDGPERTWTLKKTLRRRVSQLREKIVATRPVADTGEPHDPPDIWIPFKNHEAKVGDKVLVPTPCHVLRLCSLNL